MNNADMPAMPVDIIFGKAYDENYDNTGLTKREKFCLQMGVPETGDKSLDDIIRKGERKRITSMAMQGLLSSFGVHDVIVYDEIASDAVMTADALLKELEK